MSGSTKTTQAETKDRTTRQLPMARRILLAACLGVAGAASAPATAQAQYLHLPPVPAGLEAPEGNRAFLLQHAYGTQNYICLAAGQPWSFIGPQAVLLNQAARQTLTHFLSANPVESGVARATFPWLLLKVVGAYQGPTGGRKISRTTFIQRVNTVGGIAPLGVCPAVGARAFVPYETDYIFYRVE